jgi:hypothetical protein
MRYRAAAWTLAGLTALVLATALRLLGLDARYIDVGKLGFEAVMAVAIVLYAGTGHLLMCGALATPSDCCWPWSDCCWPWRC